VKYRSAGTPLHAALRNAKERQRFRELEIREGLALTALQADQASPDDMDVVRNMAALAAVLNPQRYELARQVFHQPAYASAARLWGLTCNDRRCMSVQEFDRRYTLLMGEPPCKKYLATPPAPAV